MGSATWRPVCWLIGHRWKVLRTNLTKLAGLVHLSTMAGQDADCERCGERWRDFYGFGITPENEHLCKRVPQQSGTGEGR